MTVQPTVLTATAGNVIASLSDGREIAVFVSLDDDGAVHADVARPFSSESQPTHCPEARIAHMFDLAPNR